MVDAPRQPPRFVPTLTEVIAEEPSVTLEPGPSYPQALEPPEAAGLELAPAVAVAPAPPVQMDWPAIEQAAVERILHRVEPLLEERLRYALSELVQVHTQGLYQLLRADVEQVLRESVSDALAEEISRSAAER